MNNQLEMVEGYSCIGNLYREGQATRHHFKHGYIETVNGKVIGGDVGFKDGDSYIDIYVYRGYLSIFRPSSQLYGSKGYATIQALRTYDKPFTLDKIRQILKKDYKDNPLVSEFMKLAKDIFESQDLEKQFDYRGDYIC